MKALLDSSILLNHLNSVPEAAEVINAYDACISSVTLDEIVQGTPREHEAALFEFLSHFEVLSVNTDTYKLALALHDELGINQHSALIYAAAKQADMILVTSNDRIFNDNWPDVKIPYRI